MNYIIDNLNKEGVQWPFGDVDLFKRPRTTTNFQNITWYVT